MKRTKIRFIILLGILCILIDVASSWYSVKYNDARLVVPMELSTYVFRVQDLPMIISVVFICLYVLYLFGLLIHAIIKNNHRNRTSLTTRKISPKMGFLGFLGFLGFGGFWTYSVNKTIFPFTFFIFFGFFGFFYEGKMSGTFMDERYKENRVKAQLASMETAITIMFLVVLVLGQGRFMENLEYTLIAVMIVLSLTLALYTFLSEYLLYHYDQDDREGESED